LSYCPSSVTRQEAIIIFQFFIYSKLFAHLSQFSCFPVASARTEILNGIYKIGKFL